MKLVDTCPGPGWRWHNDNGVLKAALVTARHGQLFCYGRPVASSRFAGCQWSDEALPLPEDAPNDVVQQVDIHWARAPVDTTEGPDAD